MSRSSLRTALRFGALLAVALAAPLGHAQNDTIRTLVLSDADPGTGDGAAFERFFDATLNDAGDVFFAATLDGPGVTSANDRGLWLLTRTGNLVLVAREGDPAPSASVPGAAFRDFTTPAPINAAGVVAFRARFTGPGVDDGNNEGVYLASAAGLVPVLVEGDAAPDRPGLLVSDPRNITGAFDRPALNDAGELAFRAQLFDPAIGNIIGSALYTGLPTALTPLLQDERPVSVPGFPDATLFDFGDIPELLSDGTVATSARVDNASGRTDLLGFADSKDAFDPVAVQGEAAPGGGTFGGGAFGTFDGFTANQQRDLAFRSFVNVGSSAERRIVAGRTGALREVATTGDPAPGVPDKTLASVANLRLGYDGEVAFTSFLVPTGILENEAVYATAGGEPVLLAREGDPAPDGGTFAAPDDPVIGDGVVVFPTGGALFSLDALYRWTPEGGVRALVRDALEVAPGDLRSIDGLDLATTGSGFDGGEEAGGPGEGRTITQQNVLAFTAEFTDGTAGVFTADLGGDALALTAEATSPLTVTPGGAVSFAYTVTNGTDAAATGDLFFTAERSGMVVAQGLIRSGTVAPGQSRSGTYVQDVPQNAPAGSYAYTLRLGTFPAPSVAEETFTLTVTGVGPAGRAAAWTVTEATPWETEGPQASAHAAGAASASVEAFPNPFADTATLRFALAETAEVRVAVYDVLGREVAVLVDGRLEAGAHEATFEAGSLPSGVYVYRLETLGATQTGRVLLVR